MARLVEELHIALSAALESEEYQTRRQVITEELRERQGQGFETSWANCPSGSERHRTSSAN